MDKQNVLIVDDRPTNRAVFAKLASTLGTDIAVRTCGDSREALTILENYTPDLIIVDYSMPGLNGAEFTREVRRRGDSHDVPIVVITAYDDREFRLSALEAGATDFLQSPVDRREFQSRATAMLAYRRQQLALRHRTVALEQPVARAPIALPEMLGSAADVLGQVLDTVPLLINATDRDGRCLFANAHQAATLGAEPSRLVGAMLSELLGGPRAARDAAMNRKVIAQGRATPPYEEEVEQDGIQLTYLTQKSPLRGQDGDVVGVLTSAIDITDRKRAETHLNHIARHDVLTGMPNRIMFRDRLQQEIAAARTSGRKVAVLLLDLDRFKMINDTRGHRIGDQLLERVSERIRTVIGESAFASRLGGDEFAIIHGDLADFDDIGTPAQQLLGAIGRSFDFGSHEITLTGSLGLSFWPDDGATADELLRTADLAMYAAKSSGGNGFRMFEPDMDRAAQKAAALAADLHLAIERGEFVTFYQPVFNARSGELVSAEALIRWNHPARGLLAPGEFLDLAEETGLILAIGDWILRDACRQRVMWEAAGLRLPRVSINLSPVQFGRQDVLALVRAVIQQTGIEPDALELEIVESVLVDNRESVAETLTALRALGVRIAIDDFGTGYSSFQYLRSLPIDTLKLDRSFVDGLPTSDKDAAIINAITSLGHDLGLQIVAEGVETGAQQLVLQTIGCDRLQGYHLGRPQPADQFARLFLEPGARGQAADRGA